MQNEQLSAELAAPETMQPKKTYTALHNRSAATLIANTRTVVNNALAQPETLALLEPYGYDTAELQRGLTLVHAAQDAYVGRQASLGESALLLDQLASLYQDAHAAFTAYRIVARSMFPAPGVRRALAVRGPLPREREQFFIYARTAYETALQTPEYLEVLQTRGYGAAKLQRCMTQLDAVMALYQTRADAHAEANLAKQARDEALDALTPWLREFRSVLRVIMRDHPEVRLRLQA